MSEEAEPKGEAVHRGIRWRRFADGDISFFDPDGSRWVDWAPGVDAPPRPPGWEPRQRRPRPGWRTPWRLVPVAVTVLVVVFALLQVSHPSGNQEKKETAATAALLGKCLAQHGELGGHPK